MTFTFITALELLGSFAYAISGATAGVRKGVDLFGLVVLAFATAAGGGIARDTMLGATPPAALLDWRYFAVSASAAVLAFFWHDAVERIRHPVQVSEAIGLSLFAVLGTGKALGTGVGPVGAVLLGILSGIGGGIVRDLLTLNVPNVLRGELFASAALVAAVIVVVGASLGVPTAAAATVGAIACTALRLTAIRRGWRLPVPAGRDGATTSKDRGDTSGDGA